ncbi:PPOX class F420-dependent oxidoreductase [Motilibacter aurantiacus]|uniref:PPOX class F420-dependent oxidoreductase n=1 Tax=Motilibacter aurantiacus TaxID=2714955 RepID=UPI0014096178|nr:PPOX class F420-dependent oxidoreductase [Motilibacter aurantiacus]NHC45121.1 PPOX class F420-dependent oxidoreductase [Motilibacter aurantiacus]
MPKPPLPATVLELLRKPNPAVVTTLRPDGQPVSVATWYLLQEGDEGAELLVNMDEGRKRLDYLRGDPRVSLTVLDSADWYTHVSIQGRVVQMYDDAGLTDIDRLSTHYTGAAYPTRDRGRVSARIRIERWHGWGAAENTDVEHG